MLTIEYRPKKLEDLIGQPHIQRICKGIFKKFKDTKLLPTCILLGGPFGTGKTTTARIIARYINCENDVENACGKCSSCKSFDKDANPSILEIDAASNRGINDIRELQESLKFKTPYNKKVIIIDECHQLSKEAVQAMLKTFEESNDALFIMCTTEVDSVLDTIKSRSIQLIVNSIPEVDLEQKLVYVAEKENIKITTKAISTIANLANGHARDALQLLDTVRYYNNDEIIKVKHVLSCAGYSDGQIAYEIINKFLDKDITIIDTFKGIKENPSKVIKTILRVLQTEINYHCADNNKCSFSNYTIKELIDLDHLFHSAAYYFGINDWSIYVLYHYFTCWKNNDLDALPRLR